ncbi:MAG: DUF2723 domain-containing protein [Verrucomicrobia bacterium]|nr:DUF2723 domain-containing protein [Verrucomicrobiota bacterium]
MTAVISNQPGTRDRAGAASDQSRPDFLDQQQGRFFRRADWSAFWTVLLITLGVYVYTLAPTVTLEDSGELAVASDYLGVPHPPGYPIWALLTWFFQWVFHFVKYYGYPNPAWSVGLFSAVAGALACALVAMLVSRSGSDIIRTWRRATEVLGYRTETVLCWAAGVSSGLLLAFSPVMWSQSVIVEVYSLNALFQTVILLLMYRWMCRPKEDHTLYLTAFLFGLGLTNHQTLLFMMLGLMAALWFRDRPLFRDCLVGLFLSISVYLFVKAYGMNPEPNAPAEVLRDKHLTLTLALLFLFAPLGLFFIQRQIMTEWKRVLFIVALVGVGLSFYAYMPFASEQNPPMNWGYPRTWEGFKHALTRGQYERITPTDIFSTKFLEQIASYITDLREQFSTPISLLALLPFVFFLKLDRRARTWLVTALVLFFSVSIVLVIFQNPALDIQTLFIGRVQFIQSHAVYAIWLGYGLIFGLAWLETVLGGLGVARFLGPVFAVLLPLVLVYQNGYDDNQLLILGGAEQHGHDFGWQFGHWQLRGVNGIRDDLAFKRPPEEFERIWKDYPTPDYPPEMGTNAIFFGGTDPGRFVPTYMIYSAKCRSDVYLITQNALADNTYMNVMRDLYGDTIWIPSQQDSNLAFQKYVEDVQAGRVPAGADVKVENGRVSVQGVGGVMMINGILAQMIFEENKHRHEFYVEESYVIPWMYPYLTPHGLIMKINAEPLNALPADIVKNDHDFWGWYTARLMGNPKFDRDIVARKTFSKLRSAIAGLYAFRRQFDEAEYAFRQSIDLYDLSPEANYRLADILMQQRRFSEARELIEKFLEKDKGNDRLRDFLKQISETDKADTRRNELETVFSQGKGDLQAALELAQLYRRLNMEQQFAGLTMQLLNDSSLPPEFYLEIAKLYAEARRADLLAVALQRYVSRDPSKPTVWMDLAAVQLALQQTGPALESLRQAIAAGGEPVRDAVRKDRRFDSVRNNAEFRSLVPPVQYALPATLPNMPVF